MLRGQAGGSLHIMAVLQACKADLLKELDNGEELGSWITPQSHRFHHPHLKVDGCSNVVLVASKVPLAEPLGD